MPTEDDTAYVLNGTKLWTTNGVVADLLVVMARVPKSDGHPGGISAFIVEADSPGITVHRRNAFMGLRGIENGLTSCATCACRARTSSAARARASRSR